MAASVRLLQVFLLVFISHTISGHVCLYHSRKVYNYGVFGPPYIKMTAKNEHQCYKMCLYSASCKGYNYNFSDIQPSCQLVKVNSKLNFHGKRSIRYSEITGCQETRTGISSTNMGDCMFEPCPVGTICIPVNSMNNFICLQTDSMTTGIDDSLIELNEINTTNGLTDTPTTNNTTEEQDMVASEEGDSSCSDTFCLWTISGRADRVIDFRFTRLYDSDIADCNTSSVQISDGNTTNTYCDGSRPSTLYIYEDMEINVTITLASTSPHGILAKATYYRMDECGGDLSDGDAIRYVYRNLPTSRSICKWKIDVDEGYSIVIRFTKFDLGFNLSDCNTDFIQVTQHNNTDKRYCGSGPGILVFDDSINITLQIQTKRYQFVSGTIWFSITDCSGRQNLIADSGVITSPNFTQAERKETNCSITLQSNYLSTLVISVWYLQLDVENISCTSDYVNITDDNGQPISFLCGRSSRVPVTIYTPNSIKLKLDIVQSKQAMENYGFILSFVINDHVGLSDCTFFMFGISGIITSPNDPSPSWNWLSYNWTIVVADGYRIEFMFEEFALEDTNNCKKNQVLIIDPYDDRWARYCGQCSNLRYTFKSNIAKLFYWAKRKVEHHGFKLLWDTVRLTN